MKNSEFFKLLASSTCNFCGYDVQEQTKTAYANVCVDCLDALDEE